MYSAKDAPEDEDLFVDSIVNMATGGKIAPKMRKILMHDNTKEIQARILKAARSKPMRPGKRISAHDKLSNSFSLGEGPVRAAKALAKFLYNNPNPAAGLQDIETSRQLYRQLQAERGQLISDSITDIDRQRETFFQMLRLFNDDFQRQILKTTDLNNVKSINESLAKLRTNLDNQEIATPADSINHFRTPIGAKAPDVADVFNHTFTPEQQRMFPSVFFEINRKTDPNATLEGFYGFVGSKYAVESRDNKQTPDSYKQLRFTGIGKNSFNLNQVLSHYVHTPVNLFWVPGPITGPTIPYVTDEFGEWHIEILSDVGKREHTINSTINALDRQFATNFNPYFEEPAEEQIGLLEGTIQNTLNSIERDIRNKMEEVRNYNEHLQPREKIEYMDAAREYDYQADMLQQEASDSEVELRGQQLRQYNEYRERAKIMRDEAEKIKHVKDTKFKKLEEEIKDLRNKQKDLETAQRILRSNPERYREIAKQMRGEPASRRMNPLPEFSTGEGIGGAIAHLHDLRDKHGLSYFKLKQLLHTLGSPVGIALTKLITL